MSKLPKNDSSHSKGHKCRRNEEAKITAVPCTAPKFAAKGYNRSRLGTKRRLQTGQGERPASLIRLMKGTWKFRYANPRLVPNPESKPYKAIAPNARTNIRGNGASLPEVDSSQQRSDYTKRAYIGTAHDGDPGRSDDNTGGLV